MALSKFNAVQQIAAGSIAWSLMASGAIVPTASMVDGAKFVKSDGTVAMATAGLNNGGFILSNVASGVASTDAVNKSQLDAVKNGSRLNFCRVFANTGNIATLSGLPTIDGVTLVSGDVAWLNSQTTASQNGFWSVAVGAWTRPAFWAAAATLPEGQYVIVDADGTTYKNTKWFVTNTTSLVVDTTVPVTSQDLSGTTYSASTGLSLTGTAFSVNYGTGASTAAQGNDTRITGALQTSALGTGIQTALGAAVGTAGAPVLNGGALGTPTSGVLTNATGLPTSALTGVLAATQFPALTGDVTTTAGSLTATVNNTAGSGFLKYTNMVPNETPGGLMNSSNTAFTLANTPTTLRSGGNSLMLFYNGQLLEPGSGNDYTVASAAITMLFAPASTDKLRAFYEV